MLVLSRKEGEQIHIGDDIVITITRLSKDKVRIGVEAPKNTPVYRSEIYQRIMRRKEVSTNE